METIKSQFHLVPFEPNAFSPNYSLVFKFENDFDHHQKVRWMRVHWIDSFYWSIIYLAFIFFGRIFMNNRTKTYRLKLPLIFWNLLLASFSILGTLRTWPEMIHVLKNYGFYHSVCSHSYHRLVNVSSFWTYLFVMSKLIELVDTVFIVLRGQKLIFLHWYHHATVLIFTWYCYADESSQARWYIDMNYLVHAFMYSYYALRASGIRLPRPLAMMITISQITQMIIGGIVTVYAFQMKQHGHQCQVSYDRLYAGMAIYLSYFILFANFFLKSYLTSGKKKENMKSE
ncbi:Elongation of very long chain fatty acids protein 6 [Sarcoptes scabiei]|uniref:Elongation of very long chain fatty acids protein n=1 Tax=Sarcoptes scabiei TaxID=52283 RepID=A0A834R1H8_SARSC|nr:Elongation of very long chain fatty acids protein 6 [Sarcoptes scabiei]